MSQGHNWVNFSSATSLSETGATCAHHHLGLDWITPLTEVNEILGTPQEALLIGRADQYRLGDMLIPHVMTRLLHFSKVRCAGLVNSDLTEFGGYATRNYGESLLEMRGPQLRLVHYGGDTLSLNLNDGYRMAADELEAERFESLSMISSHDSLLRYTKRRTGQTSDFAYLLEPEGEFWGAGVSFHAVGLSEPDRLTPEGKKHLLSLLRRAQFVGIRDEIGANFLESEGIDVERMPCALSVIVQACARPLRECRDRDSLEALRHRFPNGWISVETSGVAWSDFDRLTTALHEVSERHNLGIVFFESNPRFTDDPSRLRRWVEAFPEWQAAEFSSQNIWEIASLLLHSRLYCGSCLSARIICMSGGVARINVPTGTAETASYCELWEAEQVPVELDRDEDWSAALGEALSVDFAVLREHSTWLHKRYYTSFDRFSQETGIGVRLVPEKALIRERSVAKRGHHLDDEWLGSGERIPTVTSPRFARKPLQWQKMGA